MAFLKIDHAVKRYGDSTVIQGVSLEARAGEFVVFVGPSGCGKSTLLRMIAGLEDVSGGRIHIDGADVTDTPPADRDVAMVFQSYALYPHMSVRDNMAFGLKMIKTPKADIDRRVAEAAGILKLEQLLDRKPRALSGGQRQRVAIGRAIVRHPKLFLFDEPLSNLDAELRAEMRVEIARLHLALGATMVYVTHDQVEAMTLADRIVVLRAGLVEQIGTPAELYDRPVNTFVAGFIGSPKMNFLSMTVQAVEGHRVRLAHPSIANGSLTLPLREGNAVRPGDAVLLGLRPEHLSLEGSGAPISITVTSEYIENLGGSSQLYARSADGALVTVQSAGRHTTTRGDTVCLGAEIEHAYLFDANGQAL